MLLIELCVVSTFKRNYRVVQFIFRACRLFDGVSIHIARGRNIQGVEVSPETISDAGYLPVGYHNVKRIFLFQRS